MTNCARNMFIILTILSFFASNSYGDWDNWFARTYSVSLDGSLINGQEVFDDLVFDCSVSYAAYPLKWLYLSYRVVPNGSKSIVCQFYENFFAENVNEGESCNNTDNPINIATGNKFFEDKERLGPIPFSRFYNSNITIWQFSYQQHLRFEGGLITTRRPDGKDVIFSPVDGKWIVSSQRREQLTLDNSVYTLLLPNNMSETYDTTGKLLSIKNIGEEPILLSYPTNKIIITKGENQITLKIDSDNRVTQALFSDGYVIDFIYANNQEVTVLSEVRYANEETKRYLYEDVRFPSNITGVEDENGNRVSSVQYDSLGRAISSEKGPLNSGLERSKIKYNSNGTRTLTNSLGKQSTYHFVEFNGEYKIARVEGHASTNCVGDDSTVSYDSLGFRDRVINSAGSITDYEHNDRGQETSRTEAFGTPQARTTQTEWHADFSKPIKVIEPERTTEYTYDTQGRLLNSKITPTL